MSSQTETRETRLTRRLHETFPLYAFMEIGVEAMGDAVRLRAPLSRANTNHFGVMHAGVLFTLAEAAAGVAITQHRDLGAMTLIATTIEIDYVKAARTAVESDVRLTTDFLNSIRGGLAADPRHAVTVEVELRDEARVVVSRSRCRFQLRSR